jgi:hypothetical protein
VRAVDPEKTVAENAVLLLDVVRARPPAPAPHAEAGTLPPSTEDAARLTALAWTVLCLHGTPRI